MTVVYVDCRWCAQNHSARYLCEPAGMVLAGVLAKGAEGTMPQIEFPDDPIPAAQLGLGLSPQDRVLRQFVVKAATTPVAGVERATLIFTGRDLDNRVLPQWVYLGGDDEVQGVADLVATNAALAVRTAVAKRARQRPV